jgi:hypothetical protein
VVLVQLASAFDLTLAGLMLRRKPGRTSSRAADQSVWRDPEAGYPHAGIQPPIIHRIIKVEMPAKQRVTLPA